MKLTLTKDDGTLLDEWTTADELDHCMFEAVAGEAVPVTKKVLRDFLDAFDYEI